MPRRALIVVDIQRDFLPGGALGVPHGDEVIDPANKLLATERLFEVIVATQDWHPPNHGSFAANHPGRQVCEVIDLYGLPQVLWPVHCVQDTPGAEFAPTLRRDRLQRVFRKGTNPQIDSYSGFFDNGHRQSTGMGEFLRQAGIDEIYIAGLATDYCVKFSALDARQLGFSTWVVTDACRGVELKPGDVEQALQEMKASGVQMTSVEVVVKKGLGIGD